MWKPEHSPGAGEADVVVVEAPTAQRALEQVSSRYGAGAGILSATKVRRGGIAGFFARELIQLHVSGGDATAGAPTPSEATQAASAGDEAAGGGGGAAVERLLSTLTDSVDERERTFATALRKQLQPDPPAGGEAGPREDGSIIPSRQPLAPDPLPERPRVVRPAPPTTPSPAAGASPAPVVGRSWDLEYLEHLGVPALLVDALTAARDDLGCVQAAAAAVVTLCRPMPGGTQFLAGPGAAPLSVALGIPLVSPPGPAPSAGCAAAAIGGASRNWLAAHRGERWLHLVVGGADWEPLASEEPLAVSWADARDLPAALALAAGDGLVLGYSPGVASQRAGPVDVAVTLRALARRADEAERTAGRSFAAGTHSAPEDGLVWQG